jgi:hypothetical protein
VQPELFWRLLPTSIGVPGIRRDAYSLAFKAARNQFIALIGKLVVTVLIACIFARQIFSCAWE